jgi:hypothetical protein
MRLRGKRLASLQGPGVEVKPISFSALRSDRERLRSKLP